MKFSGEGFGGGENGSLDLKEEWTGQIRNKFNDADRDPGAGDSAFPFP